MAVPNFVDMVEIENEALHDLTLVCQDIVLDQLAYYLMVAVVLLGPDHNLLDIEALANNFL